VPTIDEAGVPGLYASFWHGLWVPTGTPKEPIARLNSAVQGALADATVRQRFAAQGQDVPPREQPTPAALAAPQQPDIENWWPIVQAPSSKGEQVPHRQGTTPRTVPVGHLPLSRRAPPPCRLTRASRRQKAIRRGRCVWSSALPPAARPTSSRG